MNRLQLVSLRDHLLKLRDPRNGNPHASRMYCLGMVHSALLGGQISNDTSIRIFELSANAVKHHYAKTPWPAAGDFLPF